jgi:hypothetical protein
MEAQQGGEGERFFTEWEETFESFDQMGLHENLLRGIYAYGERRGRQQRGGAGAQGCQQGIQNATGGRAGGSGSAAGRTTLLSRRSSSSSSSSGGGGAAQPAAAC